MTTQQYSDLISEYELGELLGFLDKDGNLDKKNVGKISALRNQNGLPFISVSQTCRVYSKVDLMAWFFQKRQNIVKDF